MTIVLKKGDCFLHSQWKEWQNVDKDDLFGPLTCVVTKISKKMIYYRGVYKSSFGEMYGHPMCEKVENISKRIGKLL